MLGPFATASRFTLSFTRRRYCRHCRTPPVHRCPRRRRRRRQRQRQRVTEGTAMAPWNGPNKFGKCKPFLLSSVATNVRLGKNLIPPSYAVQNSKRIINNLLLARLTSPMSTKCSIIFARWRPYVSHLICHSLGPQICPHPQMASHSVQLLLHGTQSWPTQHTHTHTQKTVHQVTALVARRLIIMRLMILGIITEQQPFPQQTVCGW